MHARAPASVAAVEVVRPSLAPANAGRRMALAALLAAAMPVAQAQAYGGQKQLAAMDAGDRCGGNKGCMELENLVRWVRSCWAA